MFAMMVLIFWFSSKKGEDSSEMSGKIVDIIQAIALRLRSKEYSVEQLRIITTIVRKGAHFSEYAAFGLFTIFALTEFIKKKWSACIFSEAFVFLYAISDEVHQFFVPGRSMAPMDVGIDSLGALCGIWIYILLFKREKKKPKKP